MAPKKEAKVRDLKPSKDAKGGATRNRNSSTNRSSNRSVAVPAGVGRAKA